MLYSEEMVMAHLFPLGKMTNLSMNYVTITVSFLKMVRYQLSKNVGVFW